jgi:hypothetical protein
VKWKRLGTLSRDVLATWFRKRPAGSTLSADAIRRSWLVAEAETGDVGDRRGGPWKCCLASVYLHLLLRDLSQPHLRVHVLQFMLLQCQSVAARRMSRHASYFQVCYESCCLGAISLAASVLSGRRSGCIQQHYTTKTTYHLKTNKQIDGRRPIDESETRDLSIRVL